MATRNRLFIAIAIFAAGIILAGRAIWLGRTPATSSARSGVSSEFVKSNLNVDVIDTQPTEDTLPNIVDQLRRLIVERLEQAPGRNRLSSDQVRDLPQAFIERFSAMINPDFERDYHSLRDRGDDRPADLARTQFEENKKWIESRRLAPLGVDGVRVRILATNGRLLPDSFSGQGLDKTVTTPSVNPMPVPRDPVGAGWDVAEIVLPMHVDPVKGEGREIVFAGFRFAWSSGRHQWIPFAAVMYYDSNESAVYPAMPFF